MKKKIPIAVVALMAIWALSSLLFTPKSKSERLGYDIYGFAKLPVLLDGRYSTHRLDSKECYEGHSA